MQVQVADHQELDEVWVTVKSDEIVDWPQVKAGLDPDQRMLVARWGGTPAAYFPGDGDDTHRFEDTWVFRKRIEP